MKNVELLGLEEQQFQEYAGRVIDHCEKGGRNTYPLRKAAQIGIGGGQGPVYDGKPPKLLQNEFKLLRMLHSFSHNNYLAYGIKIC